jgi:endonuclease-8
MPEGDTIHHAANRIGTVLAGHVPDEIATPHPRFAIDGRSGSPAGRSQRSTPMASTCSCGSRAGS